MSTISRVLFHELPALPEDSGGAHPIGQLSSGTSATAEGAELLAIIFLCIICR